MLGLEVMAIFNGRLEKEWVLKIVNWEHGRVFYGEATQSNKRPGEAGFVLQTPLLLINP